MATSIGDLLTVLDHTSARRESLDPGDAARALDRAAHLLARLRHDGVGTAALRADTTRRLADACAEAAHTFETGPGGMGELIGVTSDAVGRLRPELTNDDRWSVAVALAAITRRCAGVIARSGPYSQVPQLLSVADRSRELTRAATAAPADPEQLIGYDLPIPTSLLPRDASPARIATESMAALVTRLRATRGDPVSVRTLLGACYAGETAAYAGAVVAGSRLRGPQPEAAHAWRLLRAELARFTDRPRRRTNEPVEPTLRCALRIHEGIRQTLEQLPSGRSASRATLGVDAALLRRTALLLPALAGGFSNQLHRPTAWIAAGGTRPLHEGRVAEWLQHKPFLARGDDLYPAITALHRAAQETNRLITTLDTADRQFAARGSISRARSDTALSRR